MSNQKLKANARGASVVEYGLLTMLVSLAAIQAASLISGDVTTALSGTTMHLSQARHAGVSQETPFVFPEPDPEGGCITYTDGDDDETLAPDTTCYYLLAGSDTFNGSAATDDLTIFSGESLGPSKDTTDTVQFGSGDDYFQGYGGAILSMGAGDDTIDLIAEDNDVGFFAAEATLNLGSGNDAVRYTDAYTDNSGYDLNINTQGGNDYIDATCATSGTAVVSAFHSIDGDLDFNTDGCAGYLSLDDTNGSRSNINIDGVDAGMNIRMGYAAVNNAALSVNLSGESTFQFDSAPDADNDDMDIDVTMRWGGVGMWPYLDMEFLPGSADYSDWTVNVDADLVGNAQFVLSDRVSSSWTFNIETAYNGAEFEIFAGDYTGSVGTYPLIQSDNIVYHFYQNSISSASITANLVSPGGAVLRSFTLTGGGCTETRYGSSPYDDAPIDFDRVELVGPMGTDVVEWGARRSGSTVTSVRFCHS